MNSTSNGESPEILKERAVEEKQEEQQHSLQRFSSENLSLSDNSSPDSNLNLRQSIRISPIDFVDNNNKSKNYDNLKEIDLERGGAKGLPDSNGEIQSDSSESVDSKMNGDTGIIKPHSGLPKPEAPPGVSPNTFNVDVPKIGSYFRERSNSISSAIARKISSFKEKTDNNNDSVVKTDEVTQFNISGVKVIVRLKSEDENELKGRISFFSRSNCRDCTAVRTFFRQKRLNFVEINIDVYPQREKELIQRTGSSQVPQIFFNGNLLGGLVALNSLRNSGIFEQRIREILAKKCSEDAPAPALYGFDDDNEKEESMDELVGTIKVLRQRLPIQDRLIKMKIVKNCFDGREMVELLIHHLDCGRKKAVEVGRQLSKKHFIHHVSGENDFEDGNHFYRFLEHEPYIPKCYNFWGLTNDSEPKPAAIIGERLNKLMSAILESYASDDRRYVDYEEISKSEEFRRYLNLAQDLQRVNLLTLSQDERLAFFLNLHNAMVIHAIIRIGPPGGVIDRRSFFSDFQYIVGGYSYSISAIKNGILRNNRRGPYSLVKPFGAGDKRILLTFPKVNPLIHFGLCNGTKSSPIVRFFTPQGVEAELRFATREFFQKGGMEVNLEKRTVYLTRIINWFIADFGQEKQILKWILGYLDTSKAGLLTHLMGDEEPIHIAYQDYDWSVNSR